MHCRLTCMLQASMVHLESTQRKLANSDFLPEFMRQLASALMATHFAWPEMQVYTFLMLQLPLILHVFILLLHLYIPSTSPHYYKHCSLTDYLNGHEFQQPIKITSNYIIILLCESKNTHIYGQRRSATSAYKTQHTHGLQFTTVCARPHTTIEQLHCQENMKGMHTMINIIYG